MVEQGGVMTITIPMTKREMMRFKIGFQQLLEMGNVRTEEGWPERKAKYLTTYIGLALTDAIEREVRRHYGQADPQ